MVAEVEDFAHIRQALSAFHTVNGTTGTATVCGRFTHLLQQTLSGHLVRPPLVAPHLPFFDTGWGKGVGGRFGDGGVLGLGEALAGRRGDGVGGQAGKLVAIWGQGSGPQSIVPVASLSR
jgi:hypothetical protein